MAAVAAQKQAGLPQQSPTYFESSTPIIASDDQKPKKHDVNTVLNFFKANEDGSPPAPTYVGKPETYERPFEPHNVVIHDVTGDESKYTLDSHGFQYVPHVSKERDFTDEDQIKEFYYKEVDQLLRDVTGATRTFIFDHTIRRGTKAPDTNATPAASPSVADQLRGPVKRVHIDQSYASALSRLPFHLPSEASHLERSRVQLINVWRPIRPVRRDPLAIAQSQTVEENDLVPIGLIYEKREGETLAVRYNEKQQWYYKHAQTPDEVILIKCYDNRAGVKDGSGDEKKDAAKAKRVPHSAFEIPGTEGEEGRESIEVRCLVFYEDGE